MQTFVSDTLLSFTTFPGLSGSPGLGVDIDSCVNPEICQVGTNRTVELEFCQELLNDRQWLLDWMDQEIT